LRDGQAGAGEACRTSDDDHRKNQCGDQEEPNRDSPGAVSRIGVVANLKPQSLRQANQ
jgi:hypothetical protein